MCLVNLIWPPRLPTDAENMDCSSKRVLVTGGNSGIGKEIALYFASRGAEVFLLCRNEAKANQARDEIQSTTGNNRVCVEVLDLASFASVRGFVDRWSKRPHQDQRIDVLHNNAGTPVHEAASAERHPLKLSLPSSIPRWIHRGQAHHSRRSRGDLPSKLPLSFPPYHPPPPTRRIRPRCTDHPDQFPRRVHPAQP